MPQAVTQLGFSPGCVSTLFWPIRNDMSGIAAHCETCLIPVFPTAPIAIGRTVANSDDGALGSYTVNFSGSVPAIEGAWLVAAIADDSSSDAVITGGSAWTRGPGGVISGSSKSAQIWYKRCGASEPAFYTVLSSGNGSCVALVEILNAASVNPDDVSTVNNTGTPSSAVSTNDNDCAILVAITLNGSIGDFTAPTGYLLQANAIYGFSTLLANIASNLMVGSGTINPPNWGNPETSNSFLWTILLKPTS